MDADTRRHERAVPLPLARALRSWPRPRSHFKGASEEAETAERDDLAQPSNTISNTVQAEGYHFGENQSQARSRSCTGQNKEAVRRRRLHFLEEIAFSAAGMRTTTWIAGGLAGAVLLFSGCSKSGSGPEAGAAQPVPVNVPKLRDTCASGTAAVKAGANRAIMALRVANYAGALAELEKLAANPGLTEQQKQAVKEVTEQVKHNLALSPPSPNE
jgi:hypothetical protein